MTASSDGARERGLGGRGALHQLASHICVTCLGPAGFKSASWIRPVSPVGVGVV